MDEPHGLPRSSGAETEGEAESPLAHLVDMVSRRIATAIVIAGALIALAIYFRPAPPHYAAFAAGGEVIRIDTKTGSMIACGAGPCVLMLKHGQRLERDANHRLLPKQGAQPEPAAPSKQSAP
jgi:hypothetical protein